MRRFSVVLIGPLAMLSVQAPDRSLFSSHATLEFTLRAPLTELFEIGRSDEEHAVQAAVSYAEGSREVVLDRAAVSVRGHTSRREDECTFPKLKVKFEKGDMLDRSIFQGAETLRIGTHCGQLEPGQLTPKYGRLASEHAPAREALVYKLLQTAGVPTLRTRLARIKYIDTTSTPPNPLVRPAVIVEDDEEALRRLGANGQISMEEFGSAQQRFTQQDTARLAFAEAMIGNFDWCLKLNPNDTYRCVTKTPLWNVLAATRADGSVFPVIHDFDLAGIVTGPHIWFDSVFNEDFGGASIPGARITQQTEGGQQAVERRIAVEVLSQVQRTRALFPRDVLDRTRRSFMQRKNAVYSSLQAADVDPAGRKQARSYLDTFFRAIADDFEYYRPVVAAPDTRLYLDPARAREACAAGDAVPLGTPVREFQRDGEMAQVVLLDVQWRWAPPNRCEAVQNGTAWIRAAAISTEFPARRDRP